MNPGPNFQIGGQTNIRKPFIILFLSWECYLNLFDPSKSAYLLSLRKCLIVQNHPRVVDNNIKIKIEFRKCSLVTGYGGKQHKQNWTAKLLYQIYMLYTASVQCAHLDTVLRATESKLPVLLWFDLTENIQ